MPRAMQAFRFPTEPGLDGRDSRPVGGHSERRLFAAVSLVGYGAFILLSVVEGEIAVWLWPYLLLLALQTWIVPDGLLSFAAA